MARKKDINEENIINFYMEYVLTNGKKPDSVYSFSKQYNFTEKDYYEYYIRFSESKEENVELNDNDWSSQYIPTLQRNRFRTTFIDTSNIWKLDLTKVVSYGETITTSFEIEMELIEKNIRFLKIRDYFIFDMA